ncbi:MAG: hypothetical protein ACWA49_04385 [Ruegeria sp.]
MKTQKLAMLAAVVVGVPGFVLAQSAADANGDGVLTIEEVQAVMPEIDAEGFAQLDANGDGALDQAEVAAAQDAGLLPASNG